MGAFYGYEEMIKDKIVEENIKVLLECDSSKGDIVMLKEYGVVESGDWGKIKTGNVLH